MEQSFGADTFYPLFRNAHLLTIAGNFWPRRIDTRRFPSRRCVYAVDEHTSIVVLEHDPDVTALGHLVMLHGLEGSADAGYIRSLSQSALAAGFSVSRVNLRTCGATEELCRTMYHSGLTSDTKFLLEKLAKSKRGPVILVGFSLGGNVALKLAGELGETNLLAGVCSVSAPIDLAASVRTLDLATNRLYASRFLDRLRARIRRKSQISPEVYSTTGLDQVGSVWEFDDLFTAPLFGFGSALNYYQTQSAQRFLPDIRVPTLLITAKDDPLVPFESYNQSAVRDNPNIQLLATERGGHLGFLSRTRPRFWLDGQIVSWALNHVGAECLSSVGDDRLS